MNTASIAVILIAAFVVGAGAAYVYSGGACKSELSNLRQQLSSLQEELSTKEAELSKKEEEIQKLKTQVGETKVVKVTKTVECTDCHANAGTFHTPENIEKLAKARGIQPRICTTCHTGAGTGDIHKVHEKALEENRMACRTCHLDAPSLKGATTFAIPKPMAGEILVCEQCHTYEKPGDYVDIHKNTERGCESCHLGGLLEIHKEATEKLGKA